MSNHVRVIQDLKTYIDEKRTTPPDDLRKYLSNVIFSITDLTESIFPPNTVLTSWSQC